MKICLNLEQSDFSKALQQKAGSQAPQWTIFCRSGGEKKSFAFKIHTDNPNSNTLDFQESRLRLSSRQPRGESAERIKNKPVSLILLVAFKALQLGIIIVKEEESHKSEPPPPFSLY